MDKSCWQREFVCLLNQLGAEAAAAVCVSLCVLLLSVSVCVCPPSGDEVADTHFGNNNWYGHDTKLSWMAWPGEQVDSVFDAALCV